MANEEQLEIIRQGVEFWNAWRSKNRSTRVDFDGADFRNADLAEANLAGAKLINANLGGANLEGGYLVAADLRAADLGGAILRRADLMNADLEGANLVAADLERAHLRGADFVWSDLQRASLKGAKLRRTKFIRVGLDGANLDRATFLETVLVSVDLSNTLGLATCRHRGPSGIDYRTLARSKSVPLAFWRGCGVPEALIEYMPSLSGTAIQFYSCFISYSTKDQAFADRLHADLQDHGVRCWFAPHDLPIGAKTWDRIDEAIRTRDKVLLILSEGAIASDWVEDEVMRAFAEERHRKEPVLFPVRLDDVVMETGEPWARKLRDDRNIGDFMNWKDHDTYQASFKRVLRDLKAGR